MISAAGKRPPTSHKGKRDNENECSYKDQVFVFVFVFKDLFVIDIEAETGGGRSRFHARSLTRDSIPGLDSGTPGSRPGRKAGAKLLNHPGIPLYNN